MLGECNSCILHEQESQPSGTPHFSLGDFIFCPPPWAFLLFPFLLHRYIATIFLFLSFFPLSFSALLFFSFFMNFPWSLTFTFYLFLSSHSPFGFVLPLLCLLLVATWLPPHLSQPFSLTNPILSTNHHIPQWVPPSQCLPLRPSLRSSAPYAPFR